MTQVSMTFTVHGECSAEDRKVLRNAILETLMNKLAHESLVGAERRIIARLLLGEATAGSADVGP